MVKKSKRKVAHHEKPTKQTDDIDETAMIRQALGVAVKTFAISAYATGDNELAESMLNDLESHDWGRLIVTLANMSRSFTVARSH